jgi:hypothetical protein
MVPKTLKPERNAKPPEIDLFLSTIVSGKGVKMEKNQPHRNSFDAENKRIEW